MKKSTKLLSSTAIAAIAAVSVVTSASAASATVAKPVSSLSGVNVSVASVNISSMDIETALMMVQQERTRLLDAQLQTQIQEVQNRNQQIADLNAKLQVAQQNGDQAAVQTLKGQIDALSNSQQMDMLRLQSMSNKRNEAFDLMTNFIKKMQDSRSSIIGNMR
ncbi:hypothetical protein NKT34_25295 [Paenibacillus polysaccharolyticus]|uniref:hypothetical protein n=1 Tax=Paenibacillus polysaccharolyticus TaxID=582692 RepID=UPI0012B7A75B|nr:MULTISPECIES: hypothetical protein [Paenibacillus]MCP1136587.1 hypothetical protein [Paenibacillus polysaccharolyticus]